ncbi:MAG: YbaB/EbfC family nucleoid-associated protein [Polyangiaceae bacterium]|nr:YbaB/EbfC family nucleoid-associated protein [Polyangiaceae bacterium]
MKGFGGGVNELVRQAARTQRRVEEAKKQIKDVEVSASAADGKVTAVVTCEGRVVRIDVDADFAASEGLSMALDAAVGALNAALAQADKAVDDAVAKATGGLKLPG